MVTDTEGLVLRQIKAANGRRMIVILTKRYGSRCFPYGYTHGAFGKG